MRNQAENGEQIFYDIYSEEEKGEDPDKRDTGLFFFHRDAGAKTAIINAGGWIDRTVTFWEDNTK